MELTKAEKIRNYLSDIWFLWGVCLLANIITFLFVYFKIHPGNKILALHYNVLVGVEWYGKGRNLYFIPAVGLIISAVNFVLYKAFETRENFLPFLTVFVSLCVQVILFVAVLALSRVN
jgi:hypothetical protein